MNPLMDIIKSQIGAIQGVYKSKKLALTMITLLGCFIVVGEGGKDSSIALICAAAVSVSYVIVQGIVEATAASKLIQNQDNGESSMNVDKK
jgi:hypothetical protein